MDKPKVAPPGSNGKPAATDQKQQKASVPPDSLPKTKTESPGISTSAKPLQTAKPMPAYQPAANTKSGMASRSKGGEVPPTRPTTNAPTGGTGPGPTAENPQQPGATSTATKPPGRLYCLPEGFKSSDLTPGVRFAHDEMVTTCMEQLVVAEKNPLKKAIAGPLPAGKFILILLECRLTKLLLTQNPNRDEIESVAKLIDRIARGNDRATNLLLRAESLSLQRVKMGPLGFKS